MMSSLSKSKTAWSRAMTVQKSSKHAIMTSSEEEKDMDELGMLRFSSSPDGGVWVLADASDTSHQSQCFSCAIKIDQKHLRCRRSVRNRSEDDPMFCAAFRKHSSPVVWAFPVRSDWLNFSKSSWFANMSARPDAITHSSEPKTNGKRTYLCSSWSWERWASINSTTRCCLLLYYKPGIL